MLIATLIGDGRLSQGDVSAASDALASAGAKRPTTAWLEEGTATDLTFGGIDQPAARAALEAALPNLDVVVQTDGPHRRRRLLVADMDSTMITVECIDELADFAGLKPQVAAVTEAAMRGELDFAAALDARVALLAGLDARVIEQVLAERVRPMAGAATLVRTMRAAGARTVLISGGFTHFTGRVAAMIRFEHAIANRLVVEGGRLAGRVERPIVDAQMKRATLLAEAGGHRGVAASLAVGDGANDAPMLSAAGLGVAYHAKPVAVAAADAAIRHGDLTALLWAQGYRRAEWATA